MTSWLCLSKPPHSQVVWLGSKVVIRAVKESSDTADKSVVLEAGTIVNESASVPYPHTHWYIKVKAKSTQEFQTMSTKKYNMCNVNLRVIECFAAN